MKMRVTFIAFALSGLLFGFSNAQEKENKQGFDIKQLLPKETQTSLGLGELIDRAQKNYQLIGKDDGIAKAEAEKMSAYLELGPTVSAQYGYTYQSTPKITNYSGTHQVGVTANWELYSGFSTVNKIKQKTALHRASIADKTYTQENLYLQIIQQYYAYFTNYSNLISLKQKKELLRNNVQRLEQLYKSGLSTIDDLESLKAEESLTEYQIAQKELDLEQNRLNLSHLTNSQVLDLKREELKYPILDSKADRADIVMLQEQAEGIGYQRKQLSYAPKVNIYNTFTYVEGGVNNPMLSNQKTQNVVGVSVSMMLDSFSLYKQKEAIGLSQMQALKEVAYKKDEQNKNIELYKKSLEIAKVKVRSAELGLKSAQISFENVSRRYNAQLVNYVDYLNALSQKFNAEATYVESLNNHELQKANFVFHSGQSLKTYIK